MPWILPLAARGRNPGSVAGTAGKSRIGPNAAPDGCHAQALAWACRRGAARLRVDGAASRRAFLMEVDALYCDVIVSRWEQFTGQKAERIAAAEEAAHAKG